MAETAEQAEMRALKEEVARLKKTRAAVVKALEGPPDRPTERPARKNRHGGCFMLGKDWVGVLKIRMSMRRTPPVVIPALLVGAYFCSRSHFCTPPRDDEGCFL